MKQRTKHDMAIWEHTAEGQNYAFPLNATDIWGDVIYPAINSANWSFKGTLPRGLDVADVKAVEGDKVRCKLAGASVMTASWALENVD